MVSDTPRIAELRRRLQADPASTAFAQLAEEYRRAGSYTEAVEICQSGLQRHPTYLSARVTLAHALLELARLDASQQEFEAVLAAAPDNRAALRGLAEVHRRAGHPQGALEYLERALTLSPRDMELQASVDRLRIELNPDGLAAADGHADDVLADFEVGPAAAPDHAAGSAPLAESATRRGSEVGSHALPDHGSSQAPTEERVGSDALISSEATPASDAAGGANEGMPMCDATLLAEFQRWLDVIDERREEVRQSR